MHRATPLPHELLDRPFRVSEALELGLTRKRLRSADLWMPYRGVRVPRTLEWTPRLRAESGLLVCPAGTLVVGLDALAVAGLPLPVSEEELLDRRLTVNAPVSTDPFTHDQLDVEWSPVALHVPRVLDGGVLRPADADLWLRVVLQRRHQVSAGYPTRLGRAVLDRAEGDLRVLEEAVERLGFRTRQLGRRLVAEVAGRPPDEAAS